MVVGWGGVCVQGGGGGAPGAATRALRRLSAPLPALIPACSLPEGTPSTKRWGGAGGHSAGMRAGSARGARTAGACRRSARLCRRRPLRSASPGVAAELAISLRRAAQATALGAGGRPDRSWHRCMHSSSSCRHQFSWMAVPVILSALVDILPLSRASLQVISEHCCVFSGDFTPNQTMYFPTPALPVRNIL